MKKSMSFKILLLSFVTMFLMSAPLANAQNEEVNGTIETILENIQEHNLREEDVQEELEQLSISELKDVQEYLANKHDITTIENQVLNLTEDLLTGGSSVNYVAQESLNTADEENIATQLLLGVGAVMFLTIVFGLIAVSLSNRLT